MYRRTRAAAYWLPWRGGDIVAGVHARGGAELIGCPESARPTQPATAPFVHLAQPTLPLLDDLRLAAASAVAGYLDLDPTDLGHAVLDRTPLRAFPLPAPSGSASY